MSGLGATRRRAALLLALSALAAGAGLRPAAAQSAPPAPPPVASAPSPPAPPAASAAKAPAMPSNVTVRAGGSEDNGETLRLFGYVDIDAGDARVQADEVRYARADQTVEARGNVVLSFPGAVLAGTRLLYSLKTQTGWVEDVVGYLDQDNAVLRAKKVERIAPDRLRVEDAVFTTCTQPTPYWSFRIGHGEFHLGHYAYMRNVAFRATKVPVFYSPYLVWPIKTSRAAGLLFPDFRNSTQLGFTLGIPYYWPFASNADLTLKFDAHTKVGIGLGAKLEWLPTHEGKVDADLYAINDRVRDRSRYRLNWRQSQRLGQDWILAADLETVSDFDYFTDYETDVNRAAAPQSTSTLDVTRSWSWYSLSFRMRRFDQYFVLPLGTETLLTSESVLSVLPQVELRGRSRQLGRTPFYLSFESSLSGFGRDIFGAPPGQGGVADERDLVPTQRSRWLRVDVAPQLAVPLLRTPWADVVASAAWRGTWYSKSLVTGSSEVEGPSLMRSLWSAGISFTGPRFQRIFETPGWGYSPKVKHVVEPFVEYRFRPRATVAANEVPLYDAIDGVPDRLSDLSYGLRQRFVALRAVETGRARGIATAKDTSFVGLEREAEREKKRREREAEGAAETAPELAAAAAAEAAAEAAAAESERLVPLEFGSIDLFQSYSFVRDLTPVYARRAEAGVPVGTIVDGRRYSPVTLRLRYNPTSENVVDASYTIDPANRALTETSIAALARFGETGYFSGSWYRRASANPTAFDRTSFLRTRWGMLLPRRTVSLETEWDWNLRSGALEHQGYVVRYLTQCCSFRFGYDRRNFLDNSRREFSLVVDLSGLGEVLNLQRAETR